MARDILNDEMGLPIKKGRFSFLGYTHPLNLITFEGSRRLAYFDSSTLQIGIHYSMIFSAKSVVLKNLLRHELAHYYTFLIHGDRVSAHGKEFKRYCMEFGWGKEVYETTLELQSANDAIEGDLKTEKLIIKVQKLFELARSSNKHESQLATLKANQILLKHNINLIESEDIDLSKVYVHRLLTYKRKNSKLQCIYDILTHFFVQPVLHYGRNEVRLEVTGSKANVELAQYVASFLDEQLDFIWQETKKKFPEVKGLRAKNSFYDGVAIGYAEKLKSIKSDFSSIDQKALIKIQDNLQKQVELVYNRLSSGTRSSRGIDSKASGHGQVAGRNLNIHRPVGNEKTISGLLSQ